METAIELRDALIDTPSLRGVLRTDGRGTPLFTARFEDPVAARLAERIDLALSAVHALGGQGFGALSTVVLEHEGALLFLGRLSWGEHLVVVCERTANVGLFLSRLRRWMASEERERA